MNKMRPISSVILHVAVIAIGLATSASATNYKWYGAVSGDWNDIGNWDATGIPALDATNGATNVLYVANNGANPLTFSEANGTAWCNTFQIQNGDFVFNGGTMIVTNSNSTVSHIGAFGSGGTMTVNGGRIAFASWDTLYISENGNKPCTLTITGGLIELFRYTMRGGTRGAYVTVNLNGGTMQIDQPMPCQVGGTNTFNFNGGTLKAKVYNWPYSANVNDNYAFNASPANVRDGGAIIDTNGRTCYIQAGLYHSPIAGDAAIDGGLTKNGSGTLVLMGTNTYTGATTVNAGTLTCAATGEMRFALKGDFSCNTIQGTGTVNFNGPFRIAPPTGSSVYGEWQLVDVGTLTETFNASTFGLALVDGPAFTDDGDGIYTAGGWAFNTATGILTRRPELTTIVIR